MAGRAGGDKAAARAATGLGGASEGDGRGHAGKAAAEGGGRSGGEGCGVDNSAIYARKQ